MPVFRLFVSTIESDAGKSHIRIAKSEMDRLGIREGDIVRITGQKTTCAICLPYMEPVNTPKIIFLNDSAKNIPQMLAGDIVFSGLQMFSGTGSQVKLEKIEASKESISASKITIATLPSHAKILGQDYQNRLDFGKLSGRLVSRNDRITVPTIGSNTGQEFSSVILDVKPESPHQIWTISENTKFEFQDTTNDVFVQDMPTISGLRNLARVIPIVRKIPIDEDLTITITSLEIYENGAKLRINITERIHKIEETEIFDYRTKKYVKARQPVQKLDGLPRLNITIYDDMGNQYHNIPGGSGNSGSAFPSDDPNWEIYSTYETDVSFLPLLGASDLQVVIKDLICESVQMFIPSELPQSHEPPYDGSASETVYMTPIEQNRIKLTIASGPWEFKINLD